MISILIAKQNQGTQETREGLAMSITLIVVMESGVFVQVKFTICI